MRESSKSGKASMIGKLFEHRALAVGVAGAQRGEQSIRGVLQPAELPRGCVARRREGGAPTTCRRRPQVAQRRLPRGVVGGVVDRADLEEERRVRAMPTPPSHAGVRGDGGGDGGGEDRAYGRAVDHLYRSVVPTRPDALVGPASAAAALVLLQFAPRSSSTSTIVR